MFSDTDKIFIIAEAGVNHNGSCAIAKQLIDAAHGAGADAVKFQHFNTDKLIRRNAPKAAYQDRNIGEATSQYQMLKRLELNAQDTEELKAYSDRAGILFFSTPYDIESIALLARIGVPFYKLASIDIVCHSLIRRIAETGKPLLLSTGMATDQEVADAVAAWQLAGGTAENLILLQCTTDYPSLPEDQNLLAMARLRNYVPVVGYSDHTEGIEASLAAVGLGARVIERHITLDTAMPGPDHRASLNPEMFADFVRAVRTAERALGTPEKKPTGRERENITGMRRSICAREDIPAGTTLTIDHLAFKRPGDGLPPTDANLKRILGHPTRVSIAADENIALDAFT